MVDIVQVAKVMGERGYLVFSTNDHCDPGQVVSDIMAGGRGGHVDGLTGHPMYVLAETDRADYDEQSRVAGWSLDEGPYPGFRFYRCTTD